MWLRSLIRVLKNNETIRLTNHDDSSISTFWEVFRDRVHDIICSSGCRVAGALTAERRYTNSLRVQTDSLTVLDFWYHLVEHLMQGTLYAYIGRNKLLICAWSVTIFEIRFNCKLKLVGFQSGSDSFKISGVCCVDTLLMLQLLWYINTPWEFLKAC